MQIGVDGKVVPCCHYQAHKINYPELGNVNESTLMEIWNGEGYKKLRAFFLTPEGASGCPGCFEMEQQMSFEQRKAGSLFEPVVIDMDSDRELIEQSKSWQNYHLMVQEINERKTELSCKPGSILYFASCSCNFNCVMCWQKEARSQNLRPPKRTDQEISDLFPYLTRINIEGGESFIQPILTRLIDTYERHLNPCVQFTTITNGSLLNKSLIQKLSAFPSASISISFDATTKDLFDSIRVSKEGFETVYANLLECISQRNKVGKEKFNVGVTMTVQKINIHDVSNMLRLMHKQDLFVLFLPLVNSPIPSSLIHYNDAPKEIRKIKKALDDAKTYYESLTDINETWKISCHMVELIEEMIPHHILDRKHYWVRGTINDPHPAWYKDLYGNEKPYILFFPVENDSGGGGLCRYWAPVNNWKYKVRLPEGEYRVGLTKYNIAAGPFSDWKIKVQKGLRRVITLESVMVKREKLTLKSAAHKVKVALWRVPVLRKAVHAIKKRNVRH